MSNERKARARAARWTALASLGALGVLLAQSDSTRHLMPGPISTVHGSLGECTQCHTNAGKTALSWVRAVFTASRPREDAKRCLSCHKIGKDALNPHGLDIARLEAYTKRLAATPAAQQTPLSASVRNAVLPTSRVTRDGVICATCHQEHRGQAVDLKNVSNGRCQSCHAVQFRDFEADHPNFDSYPFRRRTRINFDHSSHFRKHFAEWKKKNAASRAVPQACSQCHTPTRDSGFMKLKPFGKICATCHEGQIVGEGRASGPGGLAFLALPGLDVETLREKNIAIGAWPADSEADLTPLMKLLLGWSAQGRHALKVTQSLDLLDLTTASDEQLAQVGILAMEIKHLFYALITKRMSAILKRVSEAGGPSSKVDAVANLTANIPRDVLLAAQKEWLPNLQADIDSARFEAWINATAVVATNKPPLPLRNPERGQVSPLQTGSVAKESDDVQDGSEGQNKPAAAVATVLGPWRIDAFGRLLKGHGSPAQEFEGEEEEDDQASVGIDPDADPDLQEPDAQEPTDAPADLNAASDVDVEKWTEFGGWYRKDFAILFKPTGHRDAFLRSWLDATARAYRDNQENIAKTVFEELTGEDNIGQCTKCHSVDTAKGGARVLRWQPASDETRESAFTTFNHNPHFGIVGEKGCLTCHAMSNAKGYQETYKGHDPYRFQSNFTNVKRDTCASCHRAERARNDCLLCHTYHVPGVISPVEDTKIPGR